MMAMASGAEPPRGDDDDKAPAQPVPKPMPKPPKALNEASQLINPDKLVRWARLDVPQEPIKHSFFHMLTDPHVLARVPRIQEIYERVQDKLRDPILWGAHKNTQAYQVGVGSAAHVPCVHARGLGCRRGR